MEALKANKLSKRYYYSGARPYSAREFFGGLLRSKKGSMRENWALKDVSFEAAEGETLGIIGNNGAGKSTLLKILSRITKPTSGNAIIRGRVGSLLEVGTGFHAELTGRENIFLNGAILGMKHSEIETRFDEIVEFSEVGEYLETPVKHYSSGMYMRLAFAVAAHLEPEVLIVDEVLAVGDVGFQRKCLNKMKDVGQSGRTVIFVSHDMQAVSRLCSRVLWIREGELFRDGESRAVISEYLHEQSQIGAERIWSDTNDAPGDDNVKLIGVRIVNAENRVISNADIREDVFVEIEFQIMKPSIVVPSIQLNNEQGACIFVSHDWNLDWGRKERSAKTYRSRVRIPGNFLSEGPLFVNVSAARHDPPLSYFNERDVVTFNVSETAGEISARGDLTGPIPGVVRPLLVWETD